MEEKEDRMCAPVSSLHSCRQKKTTMQDNRGLEARVGKDTHSRVSLGGMRRRTLSSDERERGGVYTRVGAHCHALSLSFTWDEEEDSNSPYPFTEIAWLLDERTNACALI